MNADQYQPVREQAERYEIIDGQVYDMSASPNLPEFWLVDSSNETIEVFRFSSSGYTLPDVFTAADDEVVPVGIFDDVQLRLADIFNA